MCKSQFLSLAFLGIFFTRVCFLKAGKSINYLPPPVGNIHVNISNMTHFLKPPHRWALGDEMAVKKITFMKMELPCAMPMVHFSLKLCNKLSDFTTCWDLCNPDQPHEVNLKGRPELIMNWSKSDNFQTGFGFTFQYEYQCNTDCSNTITLAPDISNIIKPPLLKYRNCRCIWNVIVTNDRYVIKAEFITLNLARSVKGPCLDQVLLMDTDEGSSTGPYCGYTLPKPIKTTKNNLRVVYTTRNVRPGDGFELLISNEKREGDLAGLQSVAAVLGAISFGVFLGLMLCSVLYKRWSRGRSDNEGRNEGGDNGDDYDDAIQRSAPPSYDKVLAAPEDYPSTPQASPILTRTLPTVNPPEYPGIDEIQLQVHSSQTDISPRSRQNSIADIEMMHVPPPTYEIVSESEDDWFPVTHKRSPVKSKLVGKNGQPPTYSAVTSEGSENEVGESNRFKDNRNRNRTSRSKRSLSSSIRNAQSSHGDSESDEEENIERESRRKRTSNTNINGPPLSDLPVICSDSDGEIEELQTEVTPASIDNDTSPSLLALPIDEIGRPKVIRSRSYTELARHAIINSIERSGRTAPPSPETRPRSEIDIAQHFDSSSANNSTVYGTMDFPNNSDNVFV